LLYALAIFTFSFSISSNAFRQLSGASSIFSIINSVYSLADKLSYPGLRGWNRILYTCA
jgi:hypothetical protein